MTKPPGRLKTPVRCFCALCPCRLRDCPCTEAKRSPSANQKLGLVRRPANHDAGSRVNEQALTCACVRTRGGNVSQLGQKWVIISRSLLRGFPLSRHLARKPFSYFRHIHVATTQLFFVWSIFIAVTMNTRNFDFGVVKKNRKSKFHKKNFRNYKQRKSQGIPFLVCVCVFFFFQTWQQEARKELMAEPPTWWPRLTLHRDNVINTSELEQSAFTQD